MSRAAEEMLYLAMEDFRVDVVIGKGPGATAIPLEIPPFTLVGATTRAGLLPGAAARPVRLHRPPRVLRRRRARPDRAPLGRAARRTHHAGGCGRDRLAVARHAADRQPAAAPGPRLRPGPRRRHRHPRPRARRARALRGRRARPRPARPRRPRRLCRRFGGGAGRPLDARRRGRARSGRPSRRWPSRSWSGRGSSPVRRAAGSPPRPPGTTSDSPPRPAGAHALRGVRDATHSPMRHPRGPRRRLPPRARRPPGVDPGRVRAPALAAPHPPAGPPSAGTSAHAVHVGGGGRGGPHLGRLRHRARPRRGRGAASRSPTA